MEIKDYLHLYIGCDVITKWHLECVLVAVTKSDYNPYSDCKIMRKDASKVMLDASFSDIKPILRKLSDMTEEEKEKLFDHLWPTGLWGIAWSGKIDVIDHILDLQDHWSDLGERVYNSLNIKVMSYMINWLRKNSFDVDGLIPAGLAIDKTSLKN